MNNYTDASTNNDFNNIITINIEIMLAKNQYEVLNIICNTYKKSIQEYIHKALVQTMQSDIEDGNFSEALLDKLDEEDINDNQKIKNNDDNVSYSSYVKNDLENLQI